MAKIDTTLEKRKRKEDFFCDRVQLLVPVDIFQLWDEVVRKIPIVYDDDLFF